MLFTQTREDDPWPGQPRPSSRSALASKSTATCRPNSDPKAFAGCARRGRERVTLVQSGASLRATKRAPPRRGFFFEAATPRLVSAERIEGSQRPVMWDVPSGDGRVGTRSRQVAQCLAGVVPAWYVAASTSPPAGRLFPASIDFTRHFPAPSGWRQVCLVTVFYASSQIAQRTPADLASRPCDRSRSARAPRDCAGSMPILLRPTPGACSTCGIRRSSSLARERYEQHRNGDQRSR
jgi:hypothetical protein